jgi:hypothetical protein
MLGLWPRYSCRSWFKKLDILPVTCLYSYLLISFVVDNQGLFQVNSSAPCIKTRQNYQLDKQFVALFCIQKGVRYSSIWIFNALRVSLVELKTDKSRFKNVLQGFSCITHFMLLRSFSPITRMLNHTIFLISSYFFILLFIWLFFITFLPYCILYMTVYINSEFPVWFTKNYNYY